MDTFYEGSNLYFFVMIGFKALDDSRYPINDVMLVLIRGTPYQKLQKYSTGLYVLIGHP